MRPGGLAGRLVCCRDGWMDTVKPKSGKPHTLSPSLSLTRCPLSLFPFLPPFLPGVTGWDIKTGVLINCATLPPAALNMLRPRQAVSHTTDSPATPFLLCLSCLFILFLLFLLGSTILFLNLTFFEILQNCTLYQSDFFPFLSLRKSTEEDKNIVSSSFNRLSHFFLLFWNLKRINFYMCPVPLTL